MSSAAIVTPTGSFDVLEGSLNLSLRGPWFSRVEIDAEVAPVGQATLVLARDDGGPASKFIGTITHSSVWQGRARAVIVGGAGRISGEIAPSLRARNYEPRPLPIKVSTIVEDIASDAGETLTAGVQTALGALAVPRWLRAAGTAASALDALARILGLGWRVLGDGTLWIGVETWPLAADVAGLYQQGDDGHPLVIEAAQESASMIPGTVVLKQRIREVVYSVSDAARCELYYGPSAVELFATAVQSNELPQVYRETHAATVRAQNSDDTIDLEVDDARILRIASVPLRVGIPGARVLVDEKTRVRLVFEDGDPSKPYATSIDADPTASKGVARIDDTVNLGTLSYTGPGVLTWVDPTVPPIIATKVISSTPVPLRGLISSGSAKVMIR